MVHAGALTRSAPAPPAAEAERYAAMDVWGVRQMESRIPDVPKDLVDAVREGRGVLFAGAGVSRAEILSPEGQIQKYLPTWKGLLILLIGEAVKTQLLENREAARLRRAVIDERYQFAAEAIIEIVGEAQFDRVLRTVFRNPDLRPTERHKLIADIPFSAVITTNYDKLLESEYSREALPPATYTSVDEADIVAALAEGRFFILKAHGDIDRRDTIVLSTKQYRDVIHRRPGYRAALTSMFIMRKVLFIGTSLTDIEILLTLQDINEAFRGKGPPHYALIPWREAGKAVIRHWRRHYGIELLRYSATGGHPQVDEFLTRLKLEVGRPSKKRHN